MILEKNSEFNSLQRPIIYIINSLGRGGAEKSLYQMPILYPNRKFIIISLIPGGFYLEELSKLNNVFIYSLKLKNIFNLPKVVFRIVEIIRINKPIYVGSFLYISDLIASFANFIIPKYPLIWFVRHGIDASDELKVHILVRFLSFLSYIAPSLIVFNSHSVRKKHLDLYYRRKGTFVLPNTLDLDIFCPSYKNNKELLSNELVIKEEKIFLGCVSRYHPNKGILNLLKGFDALLKKK